MLIPPFILVAGDGGQVHKVGPNHCVSHLKRHEDTLFIKTLIFQANMAQSMDN
jgi:hypothetical protein